LLNAYYGGAMTMLFPSNITFPSEGLIDVMRAYPSCNLIFMAGSEAPFALSAEKDPNYMKLLGSRASTPRGNKIKKKHQGRSQYDCHGRDCHVRGRIDVEELLQIQPVPHPETGLDVFATVKRDFFTELFLPTPL
jgi:hypothetical protein